MHIYFLNLFFRFWYFVELSDVLQWNGVSVVTILMIKK